MSTSAFDSATRSTSWRTRSIAGDAPRIARVPQLPVDLLAQAHDLARELRALAEALDDGQEHLRAELVLEDVVLRAGAHRLANLGELAHRRDHHRRRRDAAGARAAEQVEPAAVARVVGEADVESIRFERRAVERARGFVLGRRLDDLDVGEGREHLPEDASRAPLVVDDEYAHR